MIRIPALICVLGWLTTPLAFGATGKTCDSSLFSQKPHLIAFASLHKPTLDRLSHVELHSQDPVQNELVAAMNYSLDAGGKRFRPLLAFLIADLYEVDPSKVEKIAQAIEFLHTSSLILDDLPAQDNADYRRGRMANHLAFPEHLSQLAATSLITEAFRQLTALKEHFPAKLVLELIGQCADYLGPKGLAYGQARDLSRTHTAQSFEEYQQVAYLKTGLAIEASIVLTAKLLKASARDLRELQSFSRHLGLLFQIRDDLLDVLKSTQEIGKTTGVDGSNGTKSAVFFLGIEGAKKEMAALVQLALNDIKKIRQDAQLLREVVFYAAAI